MASEADAQLAAQPRARARYSESTIWAAWWLPILLSASPAALAQKYPWQEFDRQITTAREVQSLGPDLFGDRVRLQDGALSFSATDVSLPGNDSLPVRFTRTYSVFNRQHYRSDEMLADWAVELPRISGTFGPDWLGTSGSPATRCSDAGPPPAPQPPNSEWAQSSTVWSFWEGLEIHIPGVTGGELLTAHEGIIKPPGGPYPWVTNDQMHVACLPSIHNGAGQGFIATAPDGTRYWFNWQAQFFMPASEQSSEIPNDVAAGTPTKAQWAVARRKHVLYATRVEDRFGNWVTYTYDNAWNAPGRLREINASDGRRITAAYGADGIASITATGPANAPRTWSYTYANTTSGRRTLRSVRQPDNSLWDIDFAAFTNAEIKYLLSYTANQEPMRGCDWLEVPQNHEAQPVGRIIHPSGALGTFTTAIREHGRSNVPLSCANVTIVNQGPGHNQNANDPNDDVNLFAISYHAFTLISKRVSGPGLPVAEWTYDYAPQIWAHYYPGTSVEWPVCTQGAQCYEPPCTDDSCAASSKAITTVSGPAGQWLRYTFGNSFKYNEGKLLKEETGTGPADILRTIDHAYDLARTGRPYPTGFGQTQKVNRDSASGEFVHPKLRTTIIQDGVTFQQQIDACGSAGCFDGFVRPTRLTRASSLGYSKTEATEYHDDLTQWVLGQVKRSTTNGIETARTDYWPASALPMRTWSFGKARQYFTYHADGTLASVTDGNNNTIAVSGWKRGIPQLIQYPATPDQPSGASQSAVVDDHGWIRLVTDENGYSTGYDYDAMGRIKRIDYPVGDTVAWNSTYQTFAPSTTPAYGLPVGHWRQAVSTGNATAITYFDALWRPVVKETYDLVDVSGTLSQSITRYDSTGRTAFVSYPQRDLSPAVIATWGNPAVAPNALGTRTEYDVLDRVTAVRQDSELGVLSTTTAYVAPFKTETTNPRSQVTRTSYIAYDQPAHDTPIGILEYAGRATEIYRDVFGKPTAIRRRWGALESWRYYAYDGYQQLWKTTEPETGATIVGYDNAGNLAWSASGLSSSTPCNGALPAVVARKATRTYDTRNRLKTLSFPDGVGNQVWTYTPDGLPDVLTTYNAPNQGEPVISASHYNKRRMLDGQGDTVTQPGWYTWGIGYGYDANGHLARHVQPDGEVVHYAPNALGQATSVSSTFATYASGAQYFPNGALQQFTYGNGIVHTMTANARQLPASSSDGAVISFQTTYDRNGNVTQIRDMARGTGYDRSMTYDGLDRLETAHSQAFGGTDGVHRFSYDALDNLRSWTLAGVKDYATYDYDAANRLTNIRNAAGASVVGLGYDVQGNLANKNGQQFSFGYDNRLRGALQSGSTTEAYRYDVHGRRVLSWSPATGVLLSQYGQDGVLRYQSDYRTNKALSFIYLAGSQIATHETPFYTGSPSVTYHHTDALGSPVATTHANQSVIERSEYEPYGKLVNRPNDNRPGYTGHVMDAATGLTYMQQRYYDPAIGRFLSVDPVTALSDPVGYFGRYHYANNNPYKFTDPDGRAWGLAAKIVKIIVKGGDVAGTVAGAVEDGKVLFSRDASLGQRLVAAGSLATEVASPVSARDVKAGANAIQGAGKGKQTGSYTNTHESGKTYDGKGSRERSQVSGQRVESETGDKHTATDWTPANNSRDAFKQESQRLDSHGGPRSDGNHNKIESPGKKMREEDLKR